MKVYMFKQHWESMLSDYAPPHNDIQAMMSQGFPSFSLASFDVLSGGCANLNVRVFGKLQESYILRVYLRDPKMALKEKNINTLLGNNIPTPTSYYVGIYDGLTFSIIKDIPGISLRDILLNHQDLKFHIMIEIGQILGKLKNFNFPQPGFFDDNFKIQPWPISLKNFTLDTLSHPTVQNVLGNETCSKIYTLFQHFDFSILEKDKPTLVHGDFDPANILVNKVNDVWKVTGVLDWEFSFAGSYLQDIANMLRYAHAMPPLFEENFLKGFCMTLPENWRTITDLLNISALLDILVRSNTSQHPNTCEDIRHLITVFLERN